ncbi:GNAT family N-acetyltransferase [Xenorhabdus cabanillasii]|uniref:Acetyl transferase n=2 Tax=Xenorhabdus cabanillasii TaxID=351673 RepID=W1J2U5_9GAMM|nr:GNAT family N-acetyltransferase [Xenorhabdus cabanillasii]PHM77517.1 N-acetyltransferase [Xenorhabdus cabanillasii JM26]REF26536.1 putative GNAT family N-acyltransferase [Xenorhabdus cabanillasii]CDL83780.1 putative acetyl transferase [Xenorhabdus cabanillasii JM26]
MQIKYSIGRQNPELIQQAFDIRRQVFTDEQGFAADIDIDGYDDIALHVVTYDDEKPIAVLRAITSDNNMLKVGRVAVLKKYRGRGIGHKVMEFIEDYGRKNNIAAIGLSSQYHAKPFYESLGYQARGEIYLEDGAEHIFMILDLA